MLKVESTVQISLANQDAKELASELYNLFEAPSNDMMNPDAPILNKSHYTMLSQLFDLLKQQVVLQQPITNTETQE